MSRDTTRLGNSVSRDTMPDLCFTKNASARWSNLQENLGSDHYIIEITLKIQRPPPKHYNFIDWDLFREIRGKDETVYDSLSDLFVRIRKDIEKATKIITTDREVPSMDARLAHLLEAKRSLLERWKAQRLNRRLRKKVSEINKLTEEHCNELNKQQWRDACLAADDTMRRGGKWTLLRHLLDDGQDKGNQRLVVNRLINKARTEGTSESVLLPTLANKYLQLDQNSNSRSSLRYGGIPAPELDAPFLEAEIREVLHNLNSRSAPGPDRVSNRLLRNLDDKAIQTMVKEINNVWKNGLVPSE